MYTIERSVWRLIDPGEIVADRFKALWGMPEYLTPELVDG